MTEDEEMRSFIKIALSYSQDSLIEENPEILSEESLPPDNVIKHNFNSMVPLVESLIEKLRSHSEDGDNEEIAMGVEIGMNRSADMLENLLRNLENGVDR